MTPKERAAKAIESSVNFLEVLDDIIEAITSNLPPEDVYPEEALEKWAKDNDFIRLNED